MIHLSDRDFDRFQRFIFEAAGITLSGAKKPLVAGRLARRIEERRLGGFGAYFELLASGTDPAEVQTAVDLLTTNETSFFREARHFEELRKCALVPRPNGRVFRAWSAASSTGEEPYSIAMVLEDCLGPRRWEVLGSDISARVLERAARGHYDAACAARILPEYLKRFCLRGTGPHEGTLLVQRYLRDRVKFRQVNLNQTLPPGLGRFDAIFLRNVLIYFSDETKRQVVARVLSLLEPGGCFFVGHAETMNGVSDAVRAVAPAAYRKL